MTEVRRVNVESPQSFLKEDNYSDVLPLQHDGIYATAWTALYDNQTPVVIKRYQVPVNPTESIADWIEYSQDINRFSETTGITASQNISTANDDEYIYFTDKLAATQDVSKILADTTVDLAARYVLASDLLASLISIPRDEHNQLAYMIDGKISNFCPSETGGFTYVDLFPAHTRQQDSRFLKPSPSHASGDRSLQLDSFITGDAYGVTGRFVGMLARNHPDVYSVFKDEWLQAQQAGNEIPHDIQQYIGFLIEDNNRFMSMLYTHCKDTESFSRLDTILNSTLYTK
ncbi:hypothetical protein I8H83_03385 [Candidatus Saccharibacteria bacterium]|nr:hypothetical protein [Candidatus Saccharibacteria bacterium]